MAKKILDTKKATHEEWLQLRSRGIGGSDAGTIMGMNPYSSLITLYSQKLGMSNPPEDNEAMRLGRDLEQYVAMRFTEQTGKAVRNDNFTYCDDEHDFIIANIDRRVVGENAGLECKTSGSFTGYNLAAGEVPSHYYCQCQHYCMVMGWDRCYLAILVLQKGIYVIPIERNDEFIQEMREREIDFWQNYIMKKQIPAPDGSEASIETLKELYPTAQEDTEIDILGLDEMIINYKALSEMVEDYTKRRDAIKAQICADLGSYEVGRGEIYGCSWKNQSKTSVDTNKLKTEYPGIYEKVTKVSEYRVFRTKKYKAKKGA